MENGVDVPACIDVPSDIPCIERTRLSFDCKHFSDSRRSELNHSVDETTFQRPESDLRPSGRRSLRTEADLDLNNTATLDRSSRTTQTL